MLQNKSLPNHFPLKKTQPKKTNPPKKPQKEATNQKEPKKTQNQRKWEMSQMIVLQFSNIKVSHLTHVITSNAKKDMSNVNKVK